MGSTESILEAKLKHTNREIEEICHSKGVPPDSLEDNTDKFNSQELDTLHKLLTIKLSLQESLFKDQGGSLENVVFISEYRKKGK